MTKIVKFNRSNLPNLRAEINQALKDVATKYGISIAAGNARFSDANATFKLEVSIVSANGVVKTQGRTSLETLYPQYVDKVIMLSNGVQGKVVEYHSRRFKYPFTVETLNTKKRYKTTLSQVQR